MMAPTVKFRSDQPLFKADAFRMPLWIHGPFEVLRGLTKWLTVSLHRDNPHRDPLDNPTFTHPAKAPHRNGFWTGRPVVRNAKWRTMAWRWGLVFCFLSAIKYLPGAGWWWLLDMAGELLKFVGLSMIPWCWDHLWWLPVIIVGMVTTMWVIRWGTGKLITIIRERWALKDGWYVYVLALRDQVQRRVRRR